MAKVKLGDVGQISKNSFGLCHWNDSTVAIRISIDWSYLLRKMRLQDMLSDCTLDAVGTGKDAGFCDLTIGECKDNLGRLLFDMHQALAEFDIFPWNEAGHDIKQRLAMCLVIVSITCVNNDKLGHIQICGQSQDGPTQTCRTMAGPFLGLLVSKGHREKECNVGKSSYPDLR